MFRFPCVLIALDDEISGSYLKWNDGSFATLLPVMKNVYYVNDLGVFDYDSIASDQASHSSPHDFASTSFEDADGRPLCVNTGEVNWPFGVGPAQERKTFCVTSGTSQITADTQRPMQKKFSFFFGIRVVCIYIIYIYTWQMLLPNDVFNFDLFSFVFLLFSSDPNIDKSNTLKMMTNEMHCTERLPTISRMDR